MNIDLKKVQKASHLLIVTDSRGFFNASAVYTYILTLHKKVSLQISGSLPKKYSFAPWFEKVRPLSISNAEYTIEIGNNTQALYDFFVKNEIKINQKMATSLYAGMVEEFQAFRSLKCNGIVFATVCKLIELKAEHKKCTRYLLYKQPLSFVRLKSLLLSTLILKEEATVAELFLSDKKLKESGATLDDAYAVMDEALTVVHVQEVRLIKSDENNKILKIIKEMF